MTYNILFHGIGTPERTLEPGEDAFWVTEERFMEILDDVTAWPDSRLSFDDGNASDLSIALPALLERGLTADFFIIAGRLGEPGCLSEDGVREIARHGMTIGSHGMHHRPWRRLDAAHVEEEFGIARDRISDVVGTTVDSAACPFGAYDRTSLSALRRHGYRKVFTSDRRPAKLGAWLQPRWSVRSGDTPASMYIDIIGPRPPLRRARSAAIGLAKRWR
jgi:peptidoglycan/xylan/chitin deacetylase (PgdA/CDA1 family)